MGKNRKKIMAIIMCAALSVSMTAPAFASQTGEQDMPQVQSATEEQLTTEEVTENGAIDIESPEETVVSDQEMIEEPVAEETVDESAVKDEAKDIVAEEQPTKETAQEALSAEEEVLFNTASTNTGDDVVIFYNMSGNGSANKTYDANGNLVSGGSNACGADFVIVQSNGHYGIIDSGSRRAFGSAAKVGGYTCKVSDGLASNVQYKNGADAAKYMHEVLGIDHLDFVIATHSHSDHIGGMPEIANYKYSGSKGLIDSNTTYYYKPYHHVSATNDDWNSSDKLVNDGHYSWHNQQYYADAVNAMKKAGAKMVDVSSGKRMAGTASGSYNYGNINITMGDMKIRLYNLYSYTNAYDENMNSIVAVIDVNGKLVYSGGDIDEQYKQESKIVKQIRADYGGRNIDVMKASHHGNGGSNGFDALENLRPANVVFTSSSSPNPNTTSGSSGSIMYYGLFVTKTLKAGYDVTKSDIGIAFDLTGSNVNVYEIGKTKTNKNAIGAASAKTSKAGSSMQRSKSFANGWYRLDQEFKSNTVIDWMYITGGSAYTSGWKKIDNVWYHFSNSVSKAATWKTLSGKKYYFNNDSGMVTGWYKIGGKWYFFDKTDGYMKTGWLKDGNEWYFLRSNGEMAVNDYVKDSKGYCYLGADGKIVKNKWVKWNGNWYYQNASGYMATNTWQTDSKGWCYVGADGKQVKNKWVKKNGEWYYLNASGYIAKNTFAKDSKGYCYLGADGKIVKSKWVKYQNAWYYVNSSGYMVTNTWQKDSKGWCYLGSDGKMAKNKWAKKNGIWYYLNASGYIAKNTFAKGNKGYCYLGSDGKIVKGKWVKHQNVWYYVNSGGWMVTNAWQNDSKGRCYLGANGKQVKNKWIKWKGYWYYIKPNGYMAKNEKAKSSDGKHIYWMNSSGRISKTLK